MRNFYEGEADFSSCAIITDYCILSLVIFPCITSELDMCHGYYVMTVLMQHEDFLFSKLEKLPCYNMPASNPLPVSIRFLQ